MCLFSCTYEYEVPLIFFKYVLPVEFCSPTVSLGRGAFRCRCPLALADACVGMQRDRSGKGRDATNATAMIGVRWKAQGQGFDLRRESVMVAGGKARVGAAPARRM